MGHGYRPVMQDSAVHDFLVRKIHGLQEGVRPWLPNKAEGSVPVIVQMDKGQRGARFLRIRNSGNIHTGVLQSLMQQGTKLIFPHLANQGRFGS
ncbi:hypothetical protein D3C76_1009650 [compost metagenome]